MENILERVQKVVSSYNPRNTSGYVKTIRALHSAIIACRKTINENSESDRGCAQRIARELDEVLSGLPELRALVGDEEAMHNRHTKRLAEEHLDQIEAHLKGILDEDESTKKRLMHEWITRHSVFNELLQVCSNPLPKTAYVLLFQKGQDSEPTLITRRGHDKVVLSRFRTQQFTDALQLCKTYQHKPAIIGAAVISQRDLISVIGTVPAPTKNMDQLTILLAQSKKAVTKPAQDFIEHNVVLNELHELSRRRKLPKDAYVLLFRAAPGAEEDGDAKGASSDEGADADESNSKALAPGAVGEVGSAAGSEGADVAGLEDSDEAGLEDSDEAGLEGADEAGLEASDEAGLEDSDEAGLEASGEAGSEDSDEAGSEASGEAGSEASGEAGSEDSGEAGSEDSGEVGSEDSGEVGLEVSGEAGSGASGEAGLEVADGLAADGEEAMAPGAAAATAKRQAEAAAQLVAPPRPIAVEIVTKTTVDGKVVSRFWAPDFAIRHKLFADWRGKPPLVGAAIIKKTELIKTIGHVPQPPKGQAPIAVLLRASRTAVEKPSLDFVADNEVLKGLHDLANGDGPHRDGDVVLFIQPEGRGIEVLGLDVFGASNQRRTPLTEFRFAKAVHERFASLPTVIGASVIGEGQLPTKGKTSPGAGARGKYDSGRKPDSGSGSKPVIVAAFGRTPLKVSHLATEENFRRLGLDL